MIDPGKNYTTRDGFAVRIVATDAKGRFPVVGLVDMVTTGLPKVRPICAGT